MDQENRRSFVKKSLATSVSISFAGLIKAHGEEGGGTSTTWNPDGTTYFATTHFGTTWNPNQTTVVTTATSHWDVIGEISSGNQSFQWFEVPASEGVAAHKTCKTTPISVGNGTFELRFWAEPSLHADQVKLQVSGRIYDSSAAHIAATARLTLNGSIANQSTGELDATADPEDCDVANGSVDFDQIISNLEKKAWSYRVSLIANGETIVENTLPVFTDGTTLAKIEGMAFCRVECLKYTRNSTTDPWTVDPEYDVDNGLEVIPFVLQVQSHHHTSN